MTSATTVTPEQLLASEPRFKQGTKTPFNREGDRKITYTWTIGEGPMWKQTEGENPLVTFEAVLEITHHKKDRRPARYTATLWQHVIDADGRTSVIFDGSNGLLVHTDANGAGRFSMNKLQAMAPYALRKLREAHAEPELDYFRPERV
jgi:hypothetical protein